MHKACHKALALNVIMNVLEKIARRQLFINKLVFSESVSAAKLKLTMLTHHLCSTWDTPLEKNVLLQIT